MFNENKIILMVIKIFIMYGKKCGMKYFLKFIVSVVYIRLKVSEWIVFFKDFLIIGGLVIVWFC